MTQFTLTATTRDAVGKQSQKVRAAGFIPAVLYGKGVANKTISLNRSEFLKVLAAAGESTLVDVAVDSGAPVKALIHDYQQDPVLEDITHVDLYQVNMKEKLKAEIALHFVGDAPAVKEFGAIVVKSLTKFPVECLPSDLVNNIEISLAPLTAVDSVIRVKDLQLPAGITVKLDPNDYVVRMTAIQEETPEAVAATAAVNAAEVPTVEKKEKASEAQAGEEAAAEKK